VNGQSADAVQVHIPGATINQVSLPHLYKRCSVACIVLEVGGCSYWGNMRHMHVFRLDSNERTRNGELRPILLTTLDFTYMYIVDVTGRPKLY
jgi:hypothetical protein